MKILVVVGARPNFMKVAPIYKAFREQSKVRRSANLLMVHTGQHYGRMSDEFFRDLGMPEPDFNLGVGSGSHAQQTARIMVAFEDVCAQERPDCVVVVGDVNSTLGCAVTAKKLGIAVAHVEAGLRSRDMSMPEEINRLCTDAISDLLFASERSGVENLRLEGVAEERIHFVGNTMIDSLHQHLARGLEVPLPPGVVPQQYAVLTLHRPSNVDDQGTLYRLLGVINRIAECIPIIFPVHPRTAPKLQTVSLHQNLRIVDPMSYVAFLGVIARSRMVLTDSGGIQEETTLLGVPCLTMRENTERPVTCEIGTNVLVGTDPDRIFEEARAVLNGREKPHRIPEGWDGLAAHRIMEILLRYV